MQIGALGLIGAILDELRSRERDDMHAKWISLDALECRWQLRSRERDDMHANQYKLITPRKIR